MKKLSAKQLAMSYTGVFLGAGFVSGQELWQFFGAYGLGGYFGILLAVALLFLFGVLILRLAQITQETEMDWPEEVHELYSPWGGKKSDMTE